jgi:hypothetical protein
VKQFENIFRTLLVAIFGFLVPTTASAQDEVRDPMDSVEIGLVTCSPHEEIYSLYGHTALRVHDLRNNADWIFNYGVFNFKTPNFALRFVFGLTDYELGIAPTRPFLDYYEDWGSQVTEQVLNLTPEDKQRIMDALAINYKPENRIYRYNFLYDNCSTRPRDIIEHHIEGHISYNPRKDYAPSFREMIREHTSRHPWATFGNDLLLGVKADHKTDIREQEFLPENLRYDFDHATIERNGEIVPLVKERRELVRPGVQVIEEDFPLSPTQCCILLLALSIAIFAYEYIKKKTLRWFDILLMTLSGLAGLALFIMIFSEHPTTSINLQILILNPLSLFFIWPVLKGRRTAWFTLSMLCTMAFLLGSFWQDYAEGMEIVALCLLLRYWRHYHDK